MHKGIELDSKLGLDWIYERVNSLRKYLKFEGFSGTFDVAFLPNSGGMDEQDWEWVEDIQLIKYEFNKIKK